MDGTLALFKERLKFSFLYFIVGWHLLFIAIRAKFRETDDCRSWSKESQENGCRRAFRYKDLYLRFSWRFLDHSRRKARGYSPNYFSKMRFWLGCNCRSLREDRLDAKWKKVAEKENLHQEMHVESLLQRILLLWSALWAYPSNNYSCFKSNL